MTVCCYINTVLVNQGNIFNKFINIFNEINSQWGPNPMIEVLTSLSRTYTQSKNLRTHRPAANFQIFYFVLGAGAAKIFGSRARRMYTTLFTVYLDTRVFSIQMDTERRCAKNSKETPNGENVVFCSIEPLKRHIGNWYWKNTSVYFKKFQDTTFVLETEPLSHPGRVNLKCIKIKLSYSPPHPRFLLSICSDNVYVFQIVIEWVSKGEIFDVLNEQCCELFSYFYKCAIRIPSKLCTIKVT